MTRSWRSPTCALIYGRILILTLTFSLSLFAAEPRLEKDAPWYEVLGFTLEEVRMASPHEITRAFQRLALKYHPGQQGDNPPEVQARAKLAMEYVTRAWHQPAGGKQFITWDEATRKDFRPAGEPKLTTLQADPSLVEQFRAQRRRGATPAQLVKILPDKYMAFVVFESEEHGARPEEVLALWEVLSPMLSSARIADEVESPADKLALAQQISRFKTHLPSEIKDPAEARAWEDLHAWATWGYERVLEMARDGEAPVTREQVLSAFVGRLGHAREPQPPGVLPTFVINLIGLGEKAFAKASGGGPSFLEEVLRKYPENVFRSAAKSKAVVDYIRNIEPPERSHRLMGEVAKILSVEIRNLDYPDYERRRFTRKDAKQFKELAHDVALELMYKPPPGTTKEMLRALAIVSSPDQSYEGLRHFLGLGPENNTAVGSEESAMALEKMLANNEARENLLNHADRARRLIRIVNQDLPESTGPEATRKLSMLQALSKHYTGAHRKDVEEGKARPTQYNDVLRSNAFLLKEVGTHLARVEPIQKQLRGSVASTVLKWFGRGTACLLVFAASAQ